MVAETRRHLFTVDEYFRMAETGILDKNDRVELIEGEIVEMPPIGSHHAGIVNRLVTLFKELIGTEVILAPRNPIRLGRSAPQPDIALLRLRNDDYTESHPEPSDILLLVEIADSSILSDQRRKVPLYAEAGIVELWVVNLTNRTIEVHRQPSEAGFLSSFIARSGDVVTPVAFPSLPLAVDDILH